MSKTKTKTLTFYKALSVFLISFSLPLLASSNSEKSYLPSSLKQEMARFIQASKPNRSVGTKGHEGAFLFLKEEFQKIIQKTSSGGKFYLHEFLPDCEFADKNYRSDFESQILPHFPPNHPEHQKWKAFTDHAIAFVKSYKTTKGKNLILELTGATKPKEIVYVGAHFDTTTHDKKTMRFTPVLPTEGADDNASALTALLTVAKTLAQTHHDRTLRFIAFDFEEIFFLGSYAFAKDLAAKKMPWPSQEEAILGLFNLEMIGHSKTPPSRKPTVKLYTRNESKNPLAQKDIRLAEFFVSAAQKIKTKITPVILQNDFNRSDNWSFWQLGIPAVCITQDWEGDFNEENYHTTQDTVATVNFDFLSEITKTLLAMLVEAAKSK